MLFSLKISIASPYSTGVTKTIHFQEIVTKPNVTEIGLKPFSALA